MIINILIETGKAKNRLINILYNKLSIYVQFLRLTNYSFCANFAISCAAQGLPKTWKRVGELS